MRSLSQMMQRFPFFEGMYTTSNEYHKMFGGKWYLIPCQIQDDTVYIEYILGCRKDYGWLMNYQIIVDINWSYDIIPIYNIFLRQMVI